MSWEDMWSSYAAMSARIDKHTALVFLLLRRRGSFDGESLNP